MRMYASWQHHDDTKGDNNDTFRQWDEPEHNNSSSLVSDISARWHSDP